MERTFLEFFAGIGLVRLALQSCGWKVVFANDIDRGKYQMYADNFPDAPRHYRICDIHQLKDGEVPRAALAQASFPCIDLSLAGYRRGLDGEHSGTYWGFIKVLKEMRERRPPLLLIENVAGFLSSHGGEDFRTALEALGELGYAYDAFILDAIHFVPQSRPRLFIVGMMHRPRREMKLSELLNSRGSATCPRQLADFMTAHSDLNWTFQPLPVPPARVAGFASFLEDVKDHDSRWWSAERADYLLSQMSERHRRVADAMIAAPNITYGTVYRRMRQGKSRAELRTDRIAGCLRTPRGGSSRQILFVAGQGRCRARFMTPREYARLQGVPDWYRIAVPTNQALFGFGDAVCVPAIEWIARHVLEPLVDDVTDRRGIAVSV